MIISANPQPETHEFASLLEKTTLRLNDHAKNHPIDISKLAGNRLEPFIKERIEESAKGTPFENSIELISGQRFPDIVAKKFFGVEVKSSTQNHWKTTGNSVLESTRVDSVERIFMMFGKLGSPVEFKCRPYEDCLSEVVVTHSPRYLIDMNLPEGETIFDKINCKYDDLRVQSNPIKPIIEYYKTYKLKPGQELWWLDQSSPTGSSNLIIRPWSTLSAAEKDQYRVMGMAFFPEVLGNTQDKFTRFAIWLATQEAIICHNVRDVYSSGGTETITIGKKTYYQNSKVIKWFFDNMISVRDFVNVTPRDVLSEKWGTSPIKGNNFESWVKLAEVSLSSLKQPGKLVIKEMISSFRTEFRI